MLAIKFTFTANRYHATQWGRHVNEGVLEWPPSPWRILRSMVATWRRTRPDLAPDQVAPILEALTSERPKFKLPVASTGHTRHYMPYNEGSGERTTLVIDSFAAIKPQDPLYALWPNVELTAQQWEHLDSILRNMPYLGRAESWVEAELAPDFPGAANSFPIETGAIPEGNWDIVRTLIPRPSISLKDLEVETSELRRNGRIDPEGAEWWAYVRKRDCLTEFRRPALRPPDPGEGAPVVRFALAGKVLPMAFDTLRWGELARRSAMSQYGRQNGRSTSPTLSGKDAGGTRLKGHKHTFYLPTDEDGDGRLDHLTVWTPGGLTAREFQAVASMTRLNPGGHREPLQLAYQSHGEARDFADVSPLFASSKRWRSLTPYVLPRHIKYRGLKDETGQKTVIDSPEEQIAWEVSLRWPNSSNLVRAEYHNQRDYIAPMRAGRSGRFRPFNFFKDRQGGGSSGGGMFNFDLEFLNPVDGPVVLGFACHQGLGIFIPDERS